MKLLKNFSIYSLGRILVDGLKFFLIPFYTTYIPIGEYGVYNILVSIKELFLNFGSLVSRSAYHRFYFKEKDTKNTLSSVFALFMFIFLFFVILILIFSNQIRTYLFNEFPYFFYLIYLIVLIAFFQFFVTLSKTEAMMESRAFDYLIMSLLVGILPLGLIIYFVMFLGMTIQGLFYGMLMPYAGLGIYIIFKKRNLLFEKFDLEKVRNYFYYGLPLAFKRVSNTIISTGDRFVVQAMLTSAAVGAYSFIYLIASTINIFIIQPFASVIFPILLKNEENISVVQKTITNASLAILTIVSIISLFFSFFIEYIITFFVSNQEYLAHINIIYLLSIAFVILSAKSFTEKGLVFSNKPSIIMWISVFAGFGNILLNVILIPHIGLWGAVIATIITYLFMLHSLIYYSEKNHPLRYPKVRMYTIIATYSGMIFLYYIFQNSMNQIILKTFLICLYFLLLWIFRILTKSNITYVLKTIKIS